MQTENRHPSLSLFLRRFCCVIAMVVGLIYIRRGIVQINNSSLELQNHDSAELEIKVAKKVEITATANDDALAYQEELSFEEYQEQNSINNSDNESQTEDFIKQNNENDTENVKIIKIETPTPEVLGQLAGVNIGEERNADEVIKSKLQTAEINIAQTSINKITPETENDSKKTAKAEVTSKPVTKDETADAKYLSADNLTDDELEKIYEEKIPDDLVDINHLNNPKLQNKYFIPPHKPVYWGNMPVISVVIDDMGISLKHTADVSKLKYPLTASYLTYAKKLRQQISVSQKSGQQIIIHVPMEAYSTKSSETAPDVLTTNMSISQIKQKLKVMINKFPEVKGINNHMGSKFTEDKKRINAVAEILKEKNMFFLDSKTTPKSVIEDVAKIKGVAHVHRNVFIDNRNEKEYVLQQLNKAVRIAQKSGYAIAIGHPKSQTIKALQEWLPQLKDRNVRLVHISEIVDKLNSNIK